MLFAVMLVVLALLIYTVGSAVVCIRFGRYSYGEVRGIHKLAALCIGICALGIVIRMDGFDQVVSFQLLAPMAQFPFVVAMILWTYLAYVRIKGAS